MVAGCPQCRKRLHSMNEFLLHLAKDVVPAAVERIVADSRDQIRLD